MPIGRNNQVARLYISMRNFRRMEISDRLAKVIHKHPPHFVCGRPI
jgi:hypothetical protein